MSGGGVYGGGALARGYGGSSGWQQTTTADQNNVALPLQPASSQQPECCGTPCCSWRMWGIILSLLAATSLSLGIADVVVTYQNYMVNQNCAINQASAVCNPNLLVFTWVAPGIWGSIAPFIVGLMAIRKATIAASSNVHHMRMCFEVLLFLAAFVFTPAMIVLSAIEVNQQWPVFYAVPPNDITKIALPIAIAILGFLEHIMVVWTLIYLCCCRHRTGESAAVPVATRMTSFDQPFQTLNPYDLPYQAARPRTQIFSASTQLYPASYGFSSPSTPSFGGGAFNGGFMARTPSYNNYFSAQGGGRAGGIYPSVNQGQFAAGSSPNAAYSFYSR